MIKINVDAFPDSKSFFGGEGGVFVVFFKEN